MDSHALCRKIGYTSFNQPDLLRQALTHRSHSSPHNERLEFLGDSVLNCAVAGVLFRHFPQLPEGDLSRLRANLVNQQALFELAQTLGLGDEIRLGRIFQLSLWRLPYDSQLHRPCVIITHPRCAWPSPAQIWPTV